MNDSPTPAQKSEKHFGSRAAVALHEDGSAQPVKVRQLGLADYERAFAFIEDEFAFTAFCCSDATLAPASVPFDKPWALTLQPECYEGLQTSAREVNEKGFFSYAARRQERERAQQERAVAAMAGLPPETLKLAAEIGAGMAARKPTP